MAAEICQKILLYGKKPYVLLNKNKKKIKTMSKKKTTSKKTETIVETPAVESVKESIEKTLMEDIEKEVEEIVEKTLAETPVEATANESTTPVQEIDPKILQEEKERREAIKNDTIQRQKIRIIRDKYYR